MSGTRKAATEAIDRAEAAADAAQGAVADVADFACQWVRKYPMQAVAIAFVKGLVLGLCLRR